MTNFEDQQEPERPRWLFGEVILPAAMAAGVGAAAMALVAMTLSAIVGDDPWRPAQLVAGVFFRNGAPSTAGAVILGIAIHFAVAMGLATAFAMALPRGGTQAAAVLLGFGFALALQVLMPALVVPYLCPPLARAASPGAYFLLHLIFGAALGLVPTGRLIFARRIVMHPARVPQRPSSES